MTRGANKRLSTKPSCGEAHVGPTAANGHSHEPCTLYELCWLYARDGIIVARADDARIVALNPQAEELVGYGKSELIGQPIQCLHPEYEQEMVEEAFRRAASAPTLHTGFHIKRRNGALIPIEISSSSTTYVNGVPVVIGILRDVSELQDREQRLAIKRFALRAYAAGATALMKAKSRTRLIQDVCEAVTKDSPFRFAWVGTAEEDPQRSVRVLASAGPAGGYLKDIEVSWSEERVSGNGPTGISIRTGKPVVVDDCRTDERYVPWRERASSAGIRSVASMPFEMENQRAALCVYSPIVYAFGPVVVEAFQHLAYEIGVGAQTLAEREHLNAERLGREAAQQELAKMLEGVISAISTAMESRDPYTAGHQLRVSEVVTAIARELGWEEDRIEALRVAALVHDIGKISVPAEILTKPRRLSNAEWLLIKEHAEKGYDILKEIPFRWPVAEVVLQHQERMDGSGYPRGLKGDEIILGARIVAVADVLESTASVRPYRSGHGIEAALKELESQAGTKLDPEIVRVCVSLFRKKGFTLP
jgi:PAS domain S-box-containing protein/putative nucleotidyltransferase with HDIG domain